MILIPFGLLWVAYTLGWYGYATLQQPVPCESSLTAAQCPSSGCTGLTDLVLPSRVKTVDDCITNNWDKNNLPNYTPGQNNPVPPGYQFSATPPKGISA